jgi:hypothetical protein
MPVYYSTRTDRQCTYDRVQYILLRNVATQFVMSAPEGGKKKIYVSDTTPFYILTSPDLAIGSEVSPFLCHKFCIYNTLHPIILRP